MDDRDDREVRDVDEADAAEWVSAFERSHMEDNPDAAWIELVRGVEANDLDADESLERDGDVVRGTAIPPGALNLRCGHVGYYGILGRRQKTPDPTAIPYRWVCQLLVTRRDSNGKTTTAVGTGVLISPRHVLTAAHWIKWAEKDDRGQWVTFDTTAIRVVPGRYGSDTPLGEAFAKLNMKVASHWNPRTRNPQFDYGVIELESALGDHKAAALGGKKLCYWGSRECPGATVKAIDHTQLGELQGNGGITAGYANDRDSTLQYTSRGGITHVNPGATMRMAAHPWEGGSPVWINTRGEHQLVGLMLAPNVVLRITRPLCDEVRGWIGFDICSGTGPASHREVDLDSTWEVAQGDPAQEGAIDEYLSHLESFAGGEDEHSGADERSAADQQYEWAFSESAGATPAKARILWPALGFPAVIAPGSKNDADAARNITLLVLSNKSSLRPDDVSRNLRCVPWAQRGKRYLAGKFVAPDDVTIHAPKVTFTEKNESQAQLVEFGGGTAPIRASLATAVRQRYDKELPFLHEIRISESRSAQLANGQYQLFWNNAAETEDAPSDEMALLMAGYAREKSAALGELWKTHERYLLDEYEYEYGSLHRPYCSTTAPRIRAEILHPLFVDRAGMPTLKAAHLTDLHVDVRNDVYEENVKAGEYQLKAKAARQGLSSNEQAVLNMLGLFNNWNKSVVSLYNDARRDANALFLTGDLIDYGRAHWGQDAGALLQDDDLYNVNRSWFLFSYLLSTGSSYSKPVYTTLGNHDWRINPYPPFAIGAPAAKNFFYKERKPLGTVEKEKKLREWEADRADEALRIAHGDGHGRKFSYAAKAESALQLLAENPAQSVSALANLMLQTKTMNVKDTPAETTIASVEWYLLAINPFLDYAFTLPNQHRVLALDWAEKEDVLFPIVVRGNEYPYLIWQAGEAADPGPKAQSCLTKLQQDLVEGLRRWPGRSKLIAVHAPPIGPYPDWTDRDMLEGRAKYSKDKAGRARGNTDFVTQKPDGTTERWYGHPLFATPPKNGLKGMTADYGSFQNERTPFIEKAGDGQSNIRVVLSGHIHRNGAYVVHQLGNEKGPTLAGERIVYRVRTGDASGAVYPAVSKTPHGKRGPLYVNTTSAGPNGNYHPVADVDMKTYPGYARVHLAENGDIELVQFRKLGDPASQRGAQSAFTEGQLQSV
jgi:V8-like Glu-specific endopeptidase